MGKLKPHAHVAKGHPLKGVLSTSLLPSLVALMCIGWSARASAHGVVMEATPIPSFQVQIRYESGDPMANAQVNVYAPNAPQNVWLQTLADENGNFLFTPEPGLAGTWDVQARLAGHGAELQIAVQEDGTIRQLDSGDRPPLQKWLTIAAVVWGFVGTALFFSNRQLSSRQLSTRQQVPQEPPNPI